MIPQNAWIALIVVVVLVIGVNGVLILLLRSGRDARHIELWRRAAKRARDPWKAEDDALQELSRAVEPFKEKDGKGSAGQ